MSEISLRGWRCDGCGYKWYAKLKPKACAKCKRRNWDKDAEEIPRRAGETARMLESLAISEEHQILVPCRCPRKFGIQQHGKGCKQR